MEFYKNDCIVHSIIILSHKAPGFLQECLESICEATIDGEYEVIVVNDGGPEEICRTAESFAGRMPVRCIRNEKNMGISHSRNVGIEAASGTHISIFADNYILEKNHFIKKDIHLQHYDVVSSNILTVGKGLAPKAFNRYFQFVINSWTFRAERTKHGYTGSGFPAGSGSTFRADAIKETGLFDTTLISGEDSDYNHRLDLNNRSRLYAPDIIVYRKEKMTLRRLLLKEYNYGVALFKYRDRNNFDHNIRYELNHAGLILSNYYKNNRHIGYFLLVAMIHGSYKTGMILRIIRKEWRGYILSLFQWR